MGFHCLVWTHVTCTTSMIQNAPQGMQILLSLEVQWQALHIIYCRAWLCHITQIMLQEHPGTHTDCLLCCHDGTVHCMQASYIERTCACGCSSRRCRTHCTV